MQNRLTRRVILTLVLILASSVAVARAQWPPTGQLRALLDRTGLHRLTEGDPPVTTGLDDALTGIDFLDRYKPSTFAPLRAQSQRCHRRVSRRLWRVRVRRGKLLPPRRHARTRWRRWLRICAAARLEARRRATHPAKRGRPSRDSSTGHSGAAVVHSRAHADWRHATEDSANGRTAADTCRARRSQRRSVRHGHRSRVGRDQSIASTRHAPRVRSRSAFSADAQCG